MKELAIFKKWSHAHTAATLIGVAVVGFVVYKYWWEPKHAKTGGTSSFTGGKDSYLNADAKKNTTKCSKGGGTVIIDINRPACKP